MARKYTKEDRKKVLDLFYRKELRWLEKIIDNHSLTIAKESGVYIYSVNQIIDKDINQKIEIINARTRSEVTGN